MNPIPLARQYEPGPACPLSADRKPDRPMPARSSIAEHHAGAQPHAVRPPQLAECIGEVPSTHPPPPRAIAARLIRRPIRVRLLHQTSSQLLQVLRTRVPFLRPRDRQVQFRRKADTPNSRGLVLGSPLRGGRACVVLTGPRELVHGERKSFIGGYRRQHSGLGVGSPAMSVGGGGCSRASSRR